MTTPAPEQPPQKVEDVITKFRPTKLYKSPGNAHTSIDFDDKGELVCLSRTDDTIHIYDTKTGRSKSELNSAKHGCTLARFTHHSQSIIYASTKSNDHIRYLSTHDNKYISYLMGHTDRVTSLSMCPSNDTLLSASLDDTIKLWDLKDQSPTGSLNLKGATLTAYDPSATVIAIGSPATQSVILYDLRNYEKPPFATFDMLAIEKQYASSQQSASAWHTLEFSNNGKYILLGTAGVGHYLLDAFEGTCKAFLHRPIGPPPFPSPVNAKDGTVRHANAGLQGDVCFSPDGRYVISAAGTAGLVVWDTTQCETDEFAAGKRVLRPCADLPATKGSGLVAYNPKFNMLASAGSDVMLWLPEME